MGFNNTIGTPDWRIGGANVIRSFGGFPYPTVMQNAGIPAGNYQTFAPVDLSESITVDQWGVYLPSQGVGGTQQATVGLYERDSNMVPVGNPVLGLDTAAPAINLVISPAGLVMTNLTKAITIPPGQYYLSVITSSIGQTTAANLGYLGSSDPRIGSSAATELNAGLTWVPPASTPGTAPPLSNLSSYYAWQAYVRQTG